MSIRFACIYVCIPHACVWGDGVTELQMVVNYCVGAASPPYRWDISPAWNFYQTPKFPWHFPTWLCSGTSECINAVLSESHNRPLQHWPRLWGLCSVHSAVGPLSLEHWVHMGNQYALWLIGTSFSYQQFPVLKSQLPLGLSWLLNR